MCLADVFLIAFALQWSSLAQMEKINQALDTETVLIGCITSLLFLGLFIGFIISAEV